MGNLGQNEKYRNQSQKVASSPHLESPCNAELRDDEREEQQKLWASLNISIPPGISIIPIQLNNPKDSCPNSQGCDNNCSSATDCQNREQSSKHSPVLESNDCDTTEIFPIDLTTRQICSNGTETQESQATSLKNSTIFNNEIPYKCKQCSFETKIKKWLDAHMDTHVRETTLICDCCSYVTSDRGELWGHIKQCHPDNRSPPYLTNAIDNEENMLQASDFLKCVLRESSPASDTPTEPSKWFNCPDCPYKTRQRTSLTHHLTHKHTDPEVLKWVLCPHCSYRAKTSNNLRNHIMNQHTAGDQTRWHNCPNCPYKTNLKANLKKHIYIKHTEVEEEQMYKCPYCSYMAKLNSSLKTHMVTRHTAPSDIAWIKCVYCPYRAKIQAHMTTHMRQRHSDKNDHKFCCEFCAYKVNKKAFLTNHIEKYHSDKYHDRISN